MIRQELMDNVEQLMNVLQGALNLDNPPSIRLGCVEEAYKITSNIAEMVSKQLEAQRQEQSEYIIGIDFGTEDVKDMDRMLKEVDDELKMGIGIYDTEETKAFKRWCYYNNRSFNNGQVLNEYMKERGV